MIIQELWNEGIIPVIELDKIEDAFPLGNALHSAGIGCAEVTFRTGAAEEAIRILSKKFPTMNVGAGTVLTIDQVKCAIQAGAKFIVSPGIDCEVVEYCMENRIPIIPGTVTPSEITKAVKMGVEVVKFFPAERFGGLATIKSLAAPFNELKFIPTGGVNAENLEQYLRNDRILACGGSWLVAKNLINAQKFEIIENLAKEALKIVRRVRAGGTV